MGLRTNKRQVVFENDGLYLHATEHYEIIDPDLPYSQRFRTDHYTFDLNDDDCAIDITVRCSASKLAEIGMMFMAASRDAYQRMYEAKT